MLLTPCIECVQSCNILSVPSYSHCIVTAGNNCMYYRRHLSSVLNVLMYGN